MPIVPTNNGRTVAEQGSATRRRGVNLSAASFGGIGAQTLAETGNIIQGLANAEFEQREQKAKLDTQEGVVRFNNDFVARVEELKNEEVPEGTTFTKMVMNEFEERKTEFLEQQPGVSQASARASLLQSQTQIGRLAIAEENARFNKDIEDKANSVMNNIRNGVEFGSISEDVAKQQISSFSENVPGNFRESFVEQANDSLTRGKLARLTREDPETAIAQIEAGEFKDVDNTFLKKQFKSANKTLLASRQQNARLLKQAEKFRLSDPARAARSLLQSQGVEEPNFTDLSRAQTQLGVPQAMHNFITKDQADNIAAQLQNVTNVDEFYEARDALVQSAQDQAGTEDQVIQDLQDLTDLPPALNLVVSADRNVDDPKLVSTALALVRDPKAGSKARETLKDLVPAEEVPDLNEELDDVVAAVMEDQHKILIRSGASPDAVNRASNTIRDMAAISMSETMASNGRDFEGAADNAQDLLKDGMASKTDIVSDGDAITVPSDVAQDIDQDVFEGFREEVIRQARLFIPQGFADRSLLQEDLRENAGWSMASQSAVTLRHNITGQPVFLQGTDGSLAPVVLNYDDLAELANTSEVSRLPKFFRMIQRDVEEEER